MKTFLFLSFTFFIAQEIFAWGKTGHRIVGEIASQFISKETAKKIDDLLVDETLATGSNWPDEIRSDEKWKHSHHWHFLNVEPKKTFSLSQSLKQENVLWAIEEMKKRFHPPLFLKKKGRKAYSFSFIL